MQRLVKSNNGIELDDSDYDGRTCLHLACSEGHIDIVKFLMDNGIMNVNPVDRWGNTPYDDALRGENKELIELL